MGSDLSHLKVTVVIDNRNYRKCLIEKRTKKNVTKDIIFTLTSDLCFINKYILFLKFN